MIFLHSSVCIFIKIYIFPLGFQEGPRVCYYDRFFGQLAGFLHIFSYILYVMGGCSQTWWDVQVDTKIIPIRWAERVRCRLAHFFRFFFELDWRKGSIFLKRGEWEGGWFSEWVGSILGRLGRFFGSLGVSIFLTGGLPPFPFSKTFLCYSAFVLKKVQFCVDFSYLSRMKMDALSIRWEFRAGIHNGGNVLVDLQQGFFITRIQIPCKTFGK